MHAAASRDDDAAGCCEDLAQLEKADDLLDLVPDVPTLRGPALIAGFVPVMRVALATDPTPVATWAARHYRPPPPSPPTRVRIALQVFRC